MQDSIWWKDVKEAIDILVKCFDVTIFFLCVKNTEQYDFCRRRVFILSDVILACLLLLPL